MRKEIESTERTIGLAGEFAERGTIVRKVDKELHSEEEYLVVVSIPFFRFNDNLEMIDQIYTLKIDNQGDMPRVTTDYVKLLPTDWVEFIGRFGLNEDLRK